MNTTPTWNPLKRLVWRWCRQYQQVHEQVRNWTPEHCSSCRAPFARQDAMFCYQCGLPLHGGDIVTEPTLIVSSQQHQTGKLLLKYLEEHHADAGPETIKRRAILLDKRKRP